MNKWKLTVVKDGLWLEIEEVLQGNLNDCIDSFICHYSSSLEENLTRDNVRVEPLED